MANKEYRDERGTYVWRTVGGRHIKIYTGQTLSEAMKESGKFKMRKDIQDNVEFKDMKEDTIKRKGVTAKEYQRAEGNVEQLRKEYETLLREEEDYQKDWDMSEDPSFELESVAYDRSQKEEELQEARKKYDDLMKKDGFMERKFQMPVNKQQQSSGVGNEGTVSFEKENSRFQKQLERFRKNNGYDDDTEIHQSLGIEHSNEEFMNMLTENGYSEARKKLEKANLSQEEMNYIKAKSKINGEIGSLNFNNEEWGTDIGSNADTLIKLAKEYSSADTTRKMEMINDELYTAKSNKSIYTDKNNYYDLIERQLADKSQKYWAEQKRQLKPSTDELRDRKLLEKIGITSKERQDEILADREGRAISYEDYEKKMAKSEKQLREKELREKNKYATNNGSGSDDNTSAYADKALDYWKKQREDTLARGGDTAWEDDSIKRWQKEKENRLYGEKKQYESEFKAREDKIKAMNPNDKNYDVEKNHLESQQRDLVAKINELDKKQQSSSTPIYNNPDVVKEVAFSTAKAFGSKEVTVAGQKYVMGKSGQYEPAKSSLQNITIKKNPTRAKTNARLGYLSETSKGPWTRDIDLGLNRRDYSSPKDQEMLGSVVGQLSDGIWENSPGMNKYWSNMNFGYNKDGKIIMRTSAGSRYTNPFVGKTDKQVRDYVANKVKQIAKIEMDDGGINGQWDRNNTSKSSYLSYREPITVADAYSLYDRLKGRKGKQYNTFGNINLPKNDVMNLRQKYQGTYEYLKNTTNMSGAEILEYLKKIKD